VNINPQIYELWFLKTSLLPVCCSQSHYIAGHAEGMVFIMATHGDQPSNRSNTSRKARRGTKRAVGRYQITAHALDGLLKHEAEFLADALSSHFHLPIPPILRPFPTELPQLDLHIERLDDLFETVDSALLHMEHQSTHTSATLPRFLHYDAALHRATNRSIRTVVIYGPKVRKVPSTIKFPGWTYRVHNIYLGRRDGDRVYRELQRALTTGIPLTSGQRIDLVFQPLMRQKRRPQERVFREAVEQAGLLPDQDQDRAIGSLLVLAYHTLGETALNDLVEELMTTNLLVKVLGERLEQGFQQGVTQARQEDILRILHRRYTAVPDPMIAQIRRTTDPERLSVLLDSATDAQSLDQFVQVLES
jgi:hypothetical protein